MSIKKTSILALSVLLSYESFAAPTVLATTPRLGASSSVASTGRGKATTSVSIGGGLNKLTSNRGQGSFTPNSAPTDKQNELIENFQKEIQNVRDAVAEELQAQNEKIKDLEEIIEEKDEKIAELEESIDEKIENSGFITAESVTSDILTAKQEAVRQATKAAVAEVNSMGFAKTAAVQSEISSAKNAAIAQAKTEAVAEVNSMGFAKTATIESDILNAKNAAIEQAKTAALAEVESKGFATKTSIQNLKEEITNERAAALQSYATSEQVSSAVTAAKDEITNARNAALESYATSADVSNAVTAAKDDAIAAANTAIAAEAATRSAIVETLATRKELQELEVGVDKTTLDGIINEKLQEGNFATATALNDLREQVTQNTQNITEESGKIANLDVRLADTSTALTTYQGEVAGTIATLATQEALNEVNGRLANISDSVAADLVNNENFTSSVLSGLGDTVEGLTTRVIDTENAIKDLGNTYATKDGLTAVEGDISDLKANAKKIPSDVIAEMQNSESEYYIGNWKDSVTKKPLVVTSDQLTAVEGDISDLTENVKKIPSDVITSMQNSESEYYIGNWKDSTGQKPLVVTGDKLTAVEGDIADLTENAKKIPSEVIAEMQNSESEYYIGNLKDPSGKSIFVTATNFGETLSQNSTFSALNTTVNGFDRTYVKSENLSNELETTLAKKNYLSANDIDDEKSSLGSALRTVRKAADKASTDATSALSAANAAQDTANTASTNATSALAGLATKANSADVVTKTSLSDELDGLEVVTKGTLVTKFNEALNSVGSCSVDGKTTPAMDAANALRTTLSTPSTCGTGGK